MAFAGFSWVLRFCRGLVLLSLLVSGVQALLLIVEVVAVSSEPEVRLALDTTRPATFGFWHEMQRGWNESSPEPHPAPKALPKLRLASGPSFELQANSAASLLRYREASALRRGVLLALGAWSGSLSVPSVLLLALGSWLLLQLLRDVTPATPFTPANARRLLHLALLVLGLNLWDYVARVVVVLVVPTFRITQLTAPISHYVRLNTDDVVPGFWVGFILLIIAAVYQRGVELSREAELVI